VRRTPPHSIFFFFVFFQIVAPFRPHEPPPPSYVVRLPQVVICETNAFFLASPLFSCSCSLFFNFRQSSVSLPDSLPYLFEGLILAFFLLPQTTPFSPFSASFPSDPSFLKGNRTSSHPPPFSSFVPQLFLTLSADLFSPRVMQVPFTFSPFVAVFHN